MPKNQKAAAKKPEAALKELAQKVARIRALAEPIGTAWGQEIYQIKAGWASTELKEDKNIKCVQTCLEFENAMQKPETTTIFIPKEALITNEKVFEIVQRNGLVKTIFIEA